MTTIIELKLLVVEMKVFRLLRERERVRNTHIRDDLGVISLVWEVEQNEVRWHGHVMGMKEEREPKKYLEWQPQGKRPVVRPIMR